MYRKEPSSLGVGRRPSMGRAGHDTIRHDTKTRHNYASHACSTSIPPSTVCVRVVATKQGHNRMQPLRFLSGRQQPHRSNSLPSWPDAEGGEAEWRRGEVEAAEEVPGSEGHGYTSNAHVS
eukprot:GHVU01155899.1.p2 GENE.GHVU01155899.1~~GHVU01155899.1.p2  ORF type:complete len:121 (+),score=5.02 GHVU01155899.1:25-387(+)